MRGCFKKIFANFIPTPKTSRIILPSFLPGTLRSRSKAGKDRHLRLVTDEVTRPGGRVQRFSCRHYGRCVLDEHIGGTGEGRPPACRDDVRRKCLDIATAGTEQRNGREQKSPDGRPQGRIFT